MAKKSISQKRAEREQKENQTLRQVFNAFLLGLAAECYLLIVYRGYVQSSVGTALTWYSVLRWLALLGLVLAAAGVVLFVLGRKQQKSRLVKIAPWALALGLFLALSGWVITIDLDSRGVIAMCILVPILTVLALVFLLYQHECFLCTIALSGVLFTVWVRGATASSLTWRVPVIIGSVFGIAVLAAAAALCRKVQMGEGKLAGVRIFAPDCDYRINYAALAAGFVCVVAALALPALTYYLMWAVGVLLFAELVFYTTKLM